MSIWLTSDLHLGHRSVLHMNHRPFGDPQSENAVEAMNEGLIDNYNRLVGARDTVYILGDLTCRVSAGEANRLIGRLKGKKILVRGNHDSKHYAPALFEEICDYRKLRYQHCKFILMHYLLQEWDGDHRFSIHLHGHIHSTGEYNRRNLEMGIRRYDVGVDANHYCPVSLDYLVELFKTVPLVHKEDRHSYDEYYLYGFGTRPCEFYEDNHLTIENCPEIMYSKHPKRGSGPELGKVRKI